MKAIVTGVATLPALFLFAEEAEQFLMCWVTPDETVHWGKVMAGRVFQLDTNPPVDLTFSTEVTTPPGQSVNEEEGTSHFYFCSVENSTFPDGRKGA